MKKQFDINLLAAPTFSVVLPESGKRITMRSLLMKEYKTLFIAKEGKAELDAVEQALSNTIQDDIDISTLSIGDTEYIFLQLYMSSTGNNSIPVKYKCDVRDENGNKCGTDMTANIDLASAFVPKDDTDLLVIINQSTAIKMQN